MSLNERINQKIFLKTGAKASHKNNSGQTPMHVAANDTVVKRMQGIFFFFIKYISLF